MRPPLVGTLCAYCPRTAPNKGFVFSVLLLGCARMILTPDELRSLVELKHRAPHQLLGMHPLGDGSGVVVRAFVPGASAVEIKPTHEKGKPAFKLERIHDSGLYEGVTQQAKRVYAYDLVITEGQGK